VCGRRVHMRTAMKHEQAASALSLARDAGSESIRCTIMLGGTTGLYRPELRTLG
jgi:hypothetical protein